MQILKNIVAFLFVVSPLFVEAQDFSYQYFSQFNPMVNNPAFASYDSEIRTDMGMYNLWAGGFKPVNDLFVSFSMSTDTKFKKTKRAPVMRKKLGWEPFF